MPLELFHDTIAATATAEGRGALGIVRISGADAIAHVSNVVGDPESLLAARGGTSIYTQIMAGGDSIDEVVIYIYRSPRSFTGEDLCEITCHGSPVIAEEILRLLVQNGARLAEPGEFSRRAFFNGKIGLEDAELISIKANSHSECELRGAELANHEKFERLREAYDALVTLVARIDAEIDFGDSDQVEIADFPERLEGVCTSLSGLIADSSTRRENAGYFTIALTGPPNVGKSSIFNALLNFERSIVSEIPGTTRDYVEAFINIDGFRVKLIDTAGIRAADEALEARGIELGTGAARHADVSLRVTDPADRLPELANGSVLLHNKIDLDGWNSDLRLSALTGAGLAELHSWLGGELRKHSSDFSRIRLCGTEQSRLSSVLHRLSKVDLSVEPAILAEELRNAASVLAGLLGMNIGANSLDYIFAEMCIGK